MHFESYTASDGTKIIGINAFCNCTGVYGAGFLDHGDYMNMISATSFISDDIDSILDHFRLQDN